MRVLEPWMMHTKSPGRVSGGAWYTPVYSPRRNLRSLVPRANGRVASVSEYVQTLTRCCKRCRGFHKNFLDRQRIVSVENP